MSSLEFAPGLQFNRVLVPNHRVFNLHDSILDTQPIPFATHFAMTIFGVDKPLHDPDISRRNGLDVIKD